MNSWCPDVLGWPWQARTIALPDDDAGPARATLVRSGAPDPARTAVLYVHGYNDYFFQRHLGLAFMARGYDFYAVDLRRCGRSRDLLPADAGPANYVSRLSRYGQELSAATRIVRLVDGHDRMVLMGHSTGGLVAALWANGQRGRGAVDALVLNSPWLDLNSPWLARVVATRVLELLGPIAPYAVLSEERSEYAGRLWSGSGGEWDFDTRWKSPDGVPMRAGFLRAVRRAQAQVGRGLQIDCPILVCCAERSTRQPDGVDAMSSDTVLDVDQIVARAKDLGPDVTIEQVPGGIHDLSLSPEPARSRYLDTVMAWADARVQRPH